MLKLRLKKIKRKLSKKNSMRIIMIKLRAMTIKMRTLMMKIRKIERRVRTTVMMMMMMITSTIKNMMDMGIKIKKTPKVRITMKRKTSLLFSR